MRSGSSETELARPRRLSAFVETGLFDNEPDTAPAITTSASRPKLSVRFRSGASVIQQESEHVEHDEDNEWEDMGAQEDDEEPPEDSTTIATPTANPTMGPSRFSLMHRLSVIAVVIACTIGLTQYTSFLGDSRRPCLGATGLPLADAEPFPRPLEKRQSSNLTDVCKRWGQQSAIVNGTLYLYGGQSTTSPSQTSNTWNNDFLSIDLTKTWQISSPAISALSQPSGPPAVSLGYIWSSYDSLFLYGGEFSDDPQASPSANSLWEYNIKSGSWNEFQNPTTSAGPNSEPAGEPIQRAAEGAGFSMASLGKGWYFGGHLDFLTTQDWSIQTPRLYLRSFIEYTFPGYATSSGKAAGSNGSWRNITNAGIQTTNGFTQRADGILIYIPGFGAQGILLALAGGTNETFTQMNEIDVYDIAASTWYNQATSGPTPKVRVNPCAVVAAAPDGSSYNVYMFGGQNLIPAGNQTQYNDMWILSIPSFRWIPVDMTGQSVPYARAGHTCNIWDAQMVVVGGYIDPEIGCEQPGIYVFNMSSLQWVNQFTALSLTNNPFAQQRNQEGTNASAGLQGSNGYQVPAAVASVIGGNSVGGATITAPIATATSGPLASGKPITYTVTGPNGQLVTETSLAGGSGNSSSSHKPNIGAIVAGVIAGLLFIVALYLGFCALIYRKQLQLYKNHVAMAQRAAANPSNAEKAGFFAPPPGSGTAAVAGAGAARASHSRDSSWHNRSSRSSGGPVPAVPTGPRHGHADSYGGHSTSTSGHGGYRSVGRSSDDGADSSTEDLLGGMEPTFMGVMLHPRRSLRVVNRD